MDKPPVHMAQIPEEIEQLVGIYRTLAPKHVVEIGTYQGGTLWYWLKHAVPNAKVVAIDLGPNEGWPERERKFDTSIYKTWARGDTSFYYLQGDSQSRPIKQEVARYLDNRIDFLFIDADHSYEGVRADWYNYWPLVANARGVIALHDIVPSAPHHGVHKWWEFVKEYYGGYKVDIRAKGQGWGGIGVIEFNAKPVVLQ